MLRLCCPDFYFDTQPSIYEDGLWNQDVGGQSFRGQAQSPRYWAFLRTPRVSTDGVNESGLEELIRGRSEGRRHPW